MNRQEESLRIMKEKLGKIFSSSSLEEALINYISHSPTKSDHLYPKDPLPNQCVEDWRRSSLSYANSIERTVSAQLRLIGGTASLALLRETVGQMRVKINGKYQDLRSAQSK